MYKGAVAAMKTVHYQAYEAMQATACQVCRARHDIAWVWKGRSFTSAQVARQRLFGEVVSAWLVRTQVTAPRRFFLPQD